MLQIHFITVVWGRAFLKMYLDLCLPNQLTSGNLLFFQDKPGSATYKILTTSQDLEVLRAAPIVSRLAEVLPVEFRLIDDVDRSEPYSALTECHNRAIREADQAGAAMVFLTPDSLWSNG